MPLASVIRSGVEAELGVREPGAGAAEAGLDLVDQEQRAALAAELLRAPQELGLDRPHAALALDHLGEERRGLVADGAVEPVEVAGVDEGRGLEQRREGLAEARVPGGGERAQRAAVEARA